MIVIGLTGSIGMGKTTATKMLRSLKVPVHCSDESVHELLSPGRPGTDAVRQIFPKAYNRKNQTVDRKVLRGLLGSDHAKWNMLEHALHPLVRESQQSFLRAQLLSHAKVVVLDIPLLFETGAETRVDYTMCVTAPPFLQLQRLRLRRGFSIDDLAFRLGRQMPDAEKRKRADFVVQTGLGRAYTYKILKKILEEIRS